jgi:hypothetical protein
MGAILTRVKEWLSACVAHVEAIVRPSESMNKRRCPIPLPLAKIPLFWIVLCSKMPLVPFFCMIKLSGVVLEHKEKLMIVTIEMRTMLQQSKGRPLCGMSGQGSSFNAEG